MDEIGLEISDDLVKDAVVMLLNFLQLTEPREQRVTIAAIQQQPPMNFFVTLLGVQSVIGSRDQDRVPAQPKRIGDRLAAQIVGSGVVRRIEIGQDQNFHKAGPELKRAGRPLPA